MTDPAGGAKVKLMSEEEVAYFRGAYSGKYPLLPWMAAVGPMRWIATLDAAREEARNAYTVGYANGNADHREDSAALKSIQGALVDSGLPVGPQEIWADTVRELTAERDKQTAALAEARALLDKARLLWGIQISHACAEERCLRCLLATDIDRFLGAAEGKKGA